ncbi:hypothetical protein [Sphingomonas aracearum]|uniref:Uncharacterized protein n=1 Tax=Sphingomonas aracearum TaxID=2283317 RepID=A0A369VVT4_9SPHN|nr:hypothetical protein [Sphingomonas aracearum]RDE06506.1 hypothetical protein DVW87_01975 [Sphingomonas aracearum]
MLDSLEDYRERMVAIIDRVRPYLTECTPAGVAEIVRSRDEMARVLTIFQLFVHREIFEPLTAGIDPARRRLGTELKTECILLTEEFRHSKRRWNDVDLALHWAEYQPAAVAFRRRILDHLDRVAALGRHELLHAA